MALGLVRFIAFCKTCSSLSMTLNRIGWPITGKLVRRAALREPACYSGFDGHGHRIWICLGNYRHCFGVRTVWIDQRSDGRGSAVILGHRWLIIGLGHRFRVRRRGDREVIG